MIIPSLAEVYSVDKNFEVTNKVQTYELGHADFEIGERQNGWNRLYIYTNPNVSPLEQHRAAGFLEGFATYRQIYSAFINFAGLDFKGEKYAPADVQSFLDQQLDFMDQMVKNNPTDSFWIYVGYYLEQVRYMHAGYQARIRKEKLPNL
jgi:hypothetical protein